jgi:hypothetical protein
MSNTAETVHTVSIEPHWPGVRAWIVNAYLTGDEEYANNVVAAMGCEAPREWPPINHDSAEAGR